jgi:O-methyltransferase
MDLIEKKEKLSYYPADMEKDFFPVFLSCKDFTKTMIERMYSLYKAVEYIIASDIPGDFVECGIWKGGSSMLMLLTSMLFGRTDKNIYMYDTYQGMTEPSDIDINLKGESARKLLDENINNKEYSTWSLAGLEEVKKNILSTGYPKDKLFFIEGKVEDTIPAKIPEKISILRLDTDWYESTYHELYHLYPLLSKGGVLIIDDYGHWMGAKYATDKYFNEFKITNYFHRVDYTARLLIK